MANYSLELNQWVCLKLMWEGMLLTKTRQHDKTANPMASSLVPGLANQMVVELRIDLEIDLVHLMIEWSDMLLMNAPGFQLGYC
jgi:hypothetical protein